MPIPAARLDGAGKLVPFTESDVAALGLESRGIRDGSGGRRTLKAGGSTRRMQWLVPTANLWDAAVYLAGAVTLYTDDLGKQRLSRIPPWATPDDINVAVTELESKGHQFTQDEDFNEVPVPEYTAEDLEALCELLPYSTLADEYTTSEMDRYVQRLDDQPAAQYLSLPGSAMGLQFRTSGGTAPNGISVPYNVGFPFIKARVSRKWWRVPRAAIDAGSPLFNRLFGDPATDALPYIGTCNKTEFLGYRPGTLVLLAPTIEQTYDSVAGDWNVNITYQFDWLPHGANYLYYFKSSTSGGTSGWHLASRGAWAAPGDWADPDVLFPAREFAHIFDVGAV